MTDVTNVTVVPEVFTLVAYDAQRIAELAAEVALAVELPADLRLRIEVDEASMLGRVHVTIDRGSGDQSGVAVLAVEGAAFEDLKRPRQLSDDAVRAVLARVLFRVADRLTPGFAEAPADDELDLRQQTAWDAYAMGRAERAGIAAQKARRRYHFRNRHGFTDESDALFERLWDGENLTWSQLDGMCSAQAHR